MLTNRLFTSSLCFELAVSPSCYRKPLPDDILTTIACESGSVDSIASHSKDYAPKYGNIFLP